MRKPPPNSGSIAPGSGLAVEKSEGPTWHFPGAKPAAFQSQTPGGSGTKATKKMVNMATPSGQEKHQEVVADTKEAMECHVTVGFLVL